MKVVALISGGKDSCYNMMHCVAMGHEIVALANLYPAKKGESDSYMYQTVGCEAIEIYSKAMKVPLFRREIKGYSKEVDLTYHQNNEDEVEDLYHLLKNIQDAIPIEGVSSGAILSDYQRIRVENVCSRLNLVSLAYLWRNDQKILLQEMIENQLVAIIIKTAALGLVPKLHLGQTLAQIQPHLVIFSSDFEIKSRFQFHNDYQFVVLNYEVVPKNTKYGSHICGEGGEYETFTLDCPLFEKRIIIDESEMVVHSDDGVTSVAYLLLKSLHLEEKKSEQFHFECLLPSSDKFEHISQKQALFNSNSKNTELKWKKDALYSDSSVDQYPLLLVRANDVYVSISNLFGICKSSFEEEDIMICSKDTFVKLKELLQDCKHSMADVISVYFYLADMKHFSLVNSIYKTFFQLNPPARVCICPSLSVDDLGGNDQSILFQIDCLSYKEKPGHRKKVMHVQGISHWAPANIGPYSQCTLVDDLYFVAGQIGLVPGTMTMVEGGIKNEADLSLQHVKNVLSAMNSTLSLANTAQCICYVTDDNSVDVVRSLWQETVSDDVDLLNRVVYVVADSLPRQAAVEWQVIAMGSSHDDVSTAYSTTLFREMAEMLDFEKSFEALLDKYMSDIDHHSYAPLQIRLFYTKSNLFLSNIQDLQDKLLKRYDNLPSITWVPVKKVYRHAATVSMAFLGLAVSSL